MTLFPEGTDEDCSIDELLNFTEADIIRWQSEAIKEACNPTPMNDSDIAELLAGLTD